VRRLWGLLFVTGCAAVSWHPLVLSSYGSQYAVGRHIDQGAPAVRWRRHAGVDIRADEIGDPVLASADGMVVWIADSRTYGVDIRILHTRRRALRHFVRSNDGALQYHEDPHDRMMVTRYLHLATTNVDMGERVRRGQVIGTVGLVPASGGVVHVHWELCTRLGCGTWNDGTADPIPLTVGCFDPFVHYPTDRFVLTYPVACR